MTVNETPEEKQNMTTDQTPAVAEYEWHMEANVRITAACGAGNIHGGEHDFKPGEQLVMLQWGRAGRPVDRGTWWTSFDIDGAFIIPSDNVEVLEVISETSPTKITEEDATARARQAWPEAEGFELVDCGWTFRVGAGYSAVSFSGAVSKDPQGTRRDAQRFMRRV